MSKKKKKKKKPFMLEEDGGDGAVDEPQLETNATEVDGGDERDLDQDEDEGKRKGKWVRGLKERELKILFPRKFHGKWTLLLHP